MSEPEDKALEQSSDPLADVPPLVTKPATTEDDKIEALKLIADSVAQQRQYANQAVLFHPITAAVAVALLGIVYQFLYKGSRSDWSLIGTTFAGTLMAALISVRRISGGYIDEAEAVGTWKWLDKGIDEADAAGTSDEVLLSRYDEIPIGALVLRGVRDSVNSSPKKGRRQGSNSKNAPVTGQIRGWTTINRYRRKGVGAELVEEAIRICQQKGWDGPVIAPDHANSARPLPKVYNGAFDRRQEGAVRLLEKVKEEMGVGTASAGRKGKR